MFLKSYKEMVGIRWFKRVAIGNLSIPRSQGESLSLGILEMI
jgi:hypothetical protein